MGRNVRLTSCVSSVVQNGVAYQSNMHQVPHADYRQPSRRLQLVDKAAAKSDRSAGNYSSLNVLVGSVADARVAGRADASRPTISRRAKGVRKAAGSNGEIV